MVVHIPLSSYQIQCHLAGPLYLEEVPHLALERDTLALSVLASVANYAQ